MKTLLYSLLILSAMQSCKGRPAEQTTVQRQALSQLVFASGSLQAEDQYNLTAQTDGQITRLSIEEGDLVAANTLVALIDNPQNNINTASAAELYELAERNTRPDAPALQQIQANLEAARQRLAQDQVQEQRYKRLLDQQITSQTEYENRRLAVVNSQANVQALEQQYKTQIQLYEQQSSQQRAQLRVSRSNRDNNQLRTLLGGKVYSLKKQVGDFVRRGDVIATIANPNKIYARLLIDENSMSSVSVGQSVAVQLNTHKNQPIQAKITEILPSFDAQSQSFVAKAFFVDTLEFRILNTQLEANILLGKKENVLVIPRLFLGYGNKVLLPDGSTIDVKVGTVSNEWVEILEGLSEGQIIQRYL